jgi:tripartite ATP-independent transporter DctM subunit
MELLFLAILVLTMALALASGFPVAFALPGAAIITIGLAAITGTIFAGDSSAYFAQGGPIDWLTAGVTNFRGVYWEVERDTLIAIPLFVFMGIMLQRSKIAEDLLVTMAQLFGPVPGGLGISVVFVGALLAATTGILGATVVAMGLISLPAMLRNNYSQSLATGTIAASGTLGQIIPPSIVLIILADQLASAVDQAGTARQNLYKEATGALSMPSEFGVTSTSAGDMFLGALVPGLVLVALYMLYILTVALVRPSTAPSVPFEGKRDAAFWGKVFITLVPPLTLIFVVLGSIIAGVATVNQAGAIGAVGAMIMAGYRLKEGQPRAMVPALLALGALIAIFAIAAMFEVNVRNIRDANDQLGLTLAIIAVVVFLFALAWSGWRTFTTDDTLRGVMIDTAKTTSLVFIILLGAAMLTAAFRAFRRRRTGERVPDQPAGRLLGPVHHRDAGDLPPRLLPRLHRDRRGRGADRGADPADGPIRQYHRRLAWRDDRPEHPDIVPDTAIRFRAVLPARRGTGVGDDGEHVQGRRAVHRAPASGAGDRRQCACDGELSADAAFAIGRDCTAAAQPALAGVRRGVQVRAIQDQPRGDHGRDNRRARARSQLSYR